MNNPLLRSDPAQLAIACDMPPEGAHIRGERFQGTSDDERGQRADRSDTDLVPTPDGKGQAVPLQARGMVGLQHNIGRGIIRVIIHGVGTGKALRGRETNIVRMDINNGERQSS